MKNAVEEKLVILQELYKSDFLHPFPYEDCRKITDNKDEFEDLIPCLDLYFSDIAGYCSWGKRVKKWSAEKIADVRIKLHKSFFDRFPKFDKLKLVINERGTPKLYNQMLIFDLMRLTLTDILSEINTFRSSRVSEIKELSLKS